MSSYSFSVLWMRRCLFNISCLTFCLPAILVWILFFYRLLCYLALNSHCSVFDCDWDMTFWSYCFWNSLQRAWRRISVQIIAQLFFLFLFMFVLFIEVGLKKPIKPLVEFDQRKKEISVSHVAVFSLISLRSEWHQTYFWSLHLPCCIENKYIDWSLFSQQRSCC